MASNSSSSLSFRHPGWKVVLSGFGINLAFGLLYSWSIISKSIPADWGWTEADRSLPYATACIAFSLSMFPAGRFQDLIGPRIVALTGGVLVAAGMILASLANTPLNYIAGFGILVGSGMGFGYAAATPVALKWFPASQVGLVAGLVVSGFGLASVYMAPLSEVSIRAFGIPFTMLSFGIGVLVVVSLLSRWLVPPPSDFMPTDHKPSVAAGVPVQSVDFRPTEMLRTPQFYALWFMFACSSGGALMIISKLVKIASLQAGVQLGFALLASLGLGNGGGRILAGLVSDRIGRRVTLRASFLLQAVFIMLLALSSRDNFLGTTPALIFISFLIGANYGACASLFPSATKDFYGLKNFGANYGLLFTAWGAGGFALSLLLGYVYDKTQTFAFAYYCSAGLMISATAITFFLTPPKALRASPKLNRVTSRQPS